MSYSSIKTIIKVLRYFGWYKMNGMKWYRKTWNRGEIDFAQVISIDEILNSKVSIARLLVQKDKKARYELDKLENE